MSVVNNRISDIKTSVRDAAVELVGTYILEKENFEQYLESVVSRLDDTGLKVRQRYYREILILLSSLTRCQ